MITILVPIIFSGCVLVHPYITTHLGVVKKELLIFLHMLNYLIL